MSSDSCQLATVQEDFKEHEGINEQYKDQLIKVKVGLEFILYPIIKVTPVQLFEMANNDLQKYVNALDRYVG